MATITFNQNSNVAGAPGRSRSDGLPGKLVTVIASEAGQLELLWSPSNDQLASLTQVDATSWTFEPADGVWGSYLLKFTPASGTAPTRRVFAIRSPNRALRKPALNEQASPLASRENRGEPIVEKSDFNEPVVDDGSPWADGNYGGWYSAIDELFDAVESIPQTDGGEAAPPSQLTVAEEGPFVVDLGYIPDGSYFKRVGSTVVGDVPVFDTSNIVLKSESIYTRYPLTSHPDDDEFDDGSPDLSERGFTVTNLDASGAGAVTRVGPVLWHDKTGGGMTERQYRSTIAAGRLWLQLPAFPHQTWQVSKPVTADGLGGLFAVRIQGSSMDEFNSEDRLRTPRWIYLTKAGQQSIQLCVYSGFGQSQYVSYGFNGPGSTYNPRTFADPSDVMQFDVLYANVSPAPGSLQSLGALVAASGLRYAANLAAAAGYHPDTMGFLVNGGAGDRASRIVEVDYLRRYPHGTWFGIP